jgi:LuxR family maltose regulon positive regulatory protein
MVVRTLGSAYMMTGDVDGAIRAFDKDVLLSQRSGNRTGVIVDMRRLGDLRAMQGRLHQAHETYQQALDLAVDGAGEFTLIASRVFSGLGQLMYEWNRLDEAGRLVQQGIDLVKGVREVWSLGSYMTLARVRQAQGDRDGARQAMQVARRLAEALDYTEIDDVVVDATQARLDIAQEDLASAARWAQARALDGDEGVSGGASFYHLREIELLTLTRVHLALGEPERALEILEPLLEAAESRGRTSSLIEASLLGALAWDAQGRMERAMESLSRALTLAEPGGYVRTFLDAGESMAPLLYEAAARGIVAEYCGRLLAAFEPLERAEDLEPPAAGVRPAPTDEALIEPLSERELEVLALIAEGLSNQEIAGRLVLSLPTIKWHTSNIYGKLGVKNRTQAVAKARALGALT